MMDQSDATFFEITEEERLSTKILDLRGQKFFYIENYLMLFQKIKGRYIYLKHLLFLSSKLSTLRNRKVTLLLMKGKMELLK